MKKILLLISFFFPAWACLAQDSTATSENGFRFSRITIFAEVNTDHLLNHPADVKPSIPKSRGGGIFARYNVPFGVSHFGFSPALGICSYNLNTNAALVYATDSVSGATSTLFSVLTSKYKLNKFTANYLEVPLEFFYMTKTAIPLRLALGFKAGYLVSSHTKYKSDSSHKDKMFYIKNMPDYRYGLTFRATFGWFGLNGFYSLTPLFNKNLGPDCTPFSVGITIAPY